MQITFEAPLGQRLLNTYIDSITSRRKTDEQPFLWWCYKTRQWVDDVKKLPQGGSTNVRCRSYKAFLRHLKKHPELKGYQVILMNRYIGYNITVDL